MTKLREIADKLGLPIEKEFRLDDEQFNKLVFKIDEEGNILFWNDNTVKFVLSSWSLIDIYTKGYVLVDKSKMPKYATEDYKYFEIDENQKVIFKDGKWYLLKDGWGQNIYPHIPFL